MATYGQYCPIAKAMEVLGDRWTVLIVRDILGGTHGFNDLARGLPRLSRSLLSKRLKHLQDAGIVVRDDASEGRRATYMLTRAGEELWPVLEAVMNWGAVWAFDQPAAEDLDPLLLMWWLRGRVHAHALPEGRTVAQFDFRQDRQHSYWLVLRRDDVSLCLRPPEFEVDLWVDADLAAFYRVWLGRDSFDEAVRAGGIEVRSLPRLERSFGTWFAWSAAADAVRAAVRRKRSAEASSARAS